MKRQCLLMIILCLCGTLSAKADYTLKSPDGKLEIQVSADKKITYSLYRDGKLLMKENVISLKLADGKVLGEDVKVGKVKTGKSTEKIISPLYRTSSFNASYNEMNVELKGNYGVLFRAYNEGVAYRFYTAFKQPIVIANETAEFNFDNDYMSYLPYSTNKKNPFGMAFQNLYTAAPLTEANPDNIAFLPVTICFGYELKLTVLESDLEDYPGMFIKSEGKSTILKGVFASYPKDTKLLPARCQLVVTEKENFIAKTQGTRSFPWRVMAVTEKDTDMPVNNLVYALASPNRIGDYSWVKAGQSAWEWWNDWGISGVDFKAGINMDTYKHYIDFASEHKIPFLILDEGWYDPKSGDMLTVIPELNLPELIQYAKQRNVDLILWTVFNVLDKQLEEACAKYAAMGIKGFKVDFLDRDDQTAVAMTYRIAEATAKHKLTLDLHGFYKPTGLNRTYPNIVNFEGVFGMEEVKWSKIEKDMMQYDVTMPYIRMMAGPVDYTPGAMRNANKKDFRDVYYEPMSQGTRCHQLAMYIVHDSPLTMLADNPTVYRKEKECTQFITSIPNTNIEETKVLQGIMGEYIVTARRIKNDWYIGGLTNWNMREVSLDFSFLPEGNYKAVMFRDGINAEKKASDYKKEELSINNKTKLKIQMASAGGFAISLQKQ